MKIELGYWWPFARTAWGWVVAMASIIALDAGSERRSNRQLIDSVGWWISPHLSACVQQYRGRQSMMTQAQVQAIRDRVASGCNKTALAREFGVTRQTVYNILAA